MCNKIMVCLAYDDIRLESIQLEDVPEPATLALMSVMGLFALRARRKRAA